MKKLDFNRDLQSYSIRKIGGKYSREKYLHGVVLKNGVVLKVLCQMCYYKIARDKIIEDLDEEQDLYVVEFKGTECVLAEEK